MTDKNPQLRWLIPRNLIIYYNLSFYIVESYGEGKKCSHWFFKIKYQIDQQQLESWWIYISRTSMIVFATLIFLDIFF